MTRPGARSSVCSKAEARTRLQQAEAFLYVASITLDEHNDLATPGVAAALAVLAGIAAPMLFAAPDSESVREGKTIAKLFSFSKEFRQLE